MRDICIIDTSICTDNIGDDIIVDSVNGFIEENFADAYIHRVPSHILLDERSAKVIEKSELCFIAGTSILSSHMSRNGTWRIDIELSKLYKKSEVVSLGVGWSDYMGSPDGETSQILKNILSEKFKHSTRDNYTRSKIEELGRDVIYTACPTMWGLTEEHCREIPVSPASSVVFTLTAWRQDRTKDHLLICLLKKLYRRVYFFAQMREDMDYFESFNEGGVFIITPSLTGFDTVLMNEEIDFVGTRLHGGIRALQKKKRSLIIAVDNRAAELSADTGLPIIGRGALEKGLLSWYDHDFRSEIKLPEAKINEFVAQFQPCRNSHKFFALGF